MREPPPPGLLTRYRRPSVLDSTVARAEDLADAKASFIVKARRSVSPLVPLLAIGLLIYSSLGLATSPTGRLTRKTLPASDDEAAVKRFRVPFARNHAPAKGPVACMPTVARANGSVEYISNAAKSWWLAHAGNPPPLRVFEMDPGPVGPIAPAWLSAVGKRGPPETGWLRTQRLAGASRVPRRARPGEFAERVAWRSKEAQDYAAVLRACVVTAVAAGAGEVLIVEDDVLFTRSFARAGDWARRMLSDGGRTRVDGRGVRRKVRVCSASLFELRGKESQRLTSTVARVWRAEDGLSVADYVGNHHTHAPVDVLVNDWCRKRRAFIALLRPNPVRHRGRVSSFSSLERGGTLT